MGAVEPTPSVIVSHVDIVYRVFGSRPPSERGPRAWLRRGAGGSARTVHAVKDVSFVAHHGESIGIIGRNGSGKSTLLRAVAGLMPPTSGDVWADGTPALLGVNAVLVKQISGARNVYIGAQALGLSKAEVDAVYDDIVEFSGIGDAIDLPMSTYSSGMAARLRFAISTAAVPPVLVIDEALATGDAHFRARSQERIEKLRDHASTVFLVSHSSSSIRAMCDRAIWLEQGEVVADGPVDDVVDEYQGSTQRSLGSAAKVEPEVPGVERWSGETRYHTSALTSRRGLPESSDTVVLASGAQLALALAAVPAAAAVTAPVLLTNPSRLMPTTRTELERLAPRRVVLLGGPEVIAPEVAAALDAVGAAVDRVPGSGPVATALSLLGDLDASDAIDTIYVVPTADPEAALTASLASHSGTGRVLLVGDEGVTDEHVATLARIRPRRIRVVADTDVLPDSVLADLRGCAREGVDRVLSPTPAEAAAQASRETGREAVDVVYIASSEVGAVGDAVTGAGVAALAEAPLLLVERDSIPAPTTAELERLAPSHVVVLGGPATITLGVRSELAGYLHTDEEPESGALDAML